MTTPTGPTHRTAGHRDRQQARAQRTAAPQPKPNISKTRVGGGVHLNPSVNLSFTKASGGQVRPGGGAASGQGTVPAAAGSGTPGSDFMSNEAIRAFCEHIRREARNRAVERAMDAEQLQAVLRHIPDSNGTMAGALLRARRVSRHLKRIARAEQVIARSAAQLYAQFEREYEAELRKVSRARPAHQSRAFGWR